MGAGAHGSASTSNSGNTVFTPSSDAGDSRDTRPSLPRSRALRAWLGAIAAVSVVGSAVLGIVDARYVRRVDYDKHVAVDSLRMVSDSVFRAQLLVKADSINLRVQQLACGPRIATGCR